MDDQQRARELLVSVATDAISKNEQLTPDELAMRAITAALHAAPEGFVMVPAMPTEEMYDAGLDAGDGYDWSGPHVVWSAMLAACPQGVN